jgi:hypothetical protein
MPSVKSYLEDMLYDVKDHVGSTFSTYIAAMYSEKGSEILLPDFDEIAVGDVNVFARNLPVVLFLFPRDAPISALDTGEDEYSVDLLAVIQFEGSTAELPVKALRYAECFRQMVNGDKTMGGACDDAQVTRIQYYGPGGTDAQEMAIEISVLAILTVPNR